MDAKTWCDNVGEPVHINFTMTAVFYIPRSNPLWDNYSLQPLLDQFFVFLKNATLTINVGHLVFQNTVQLLDK